MRQPLLAANQSQKNFRIFFLQSLFILLTLTNSVKAEVEVENESEQNSSDRFSSKEAWSYGLLTGLMLAVLGLICTIIIVLLKKKTKLNFNNILKVMIGFAAGALIGNAVINLIPAAFLPSKDDPAEETEEVSDTILSLFLCLGIVVFALIERIFHLFGIGHVENDKEEDGPYHHHHYEHHLHDKNNQKNECCQNNKTKANSEIRNNQITLETLPCIRNNEKKPDANEDIESKNEQRASIDEQIPDHNLSTVSTQKVVATRPKEVSLPPMPEKNTSTNSVKKVSVTQPNEVSQPPLESKTTAGWRNKKTEGYLNLIGEFIHNLIDGIALGVTFASTTKQKVLSTIVAIVSHETPSEFGNVSILLNSNFSSLQVIICNIILNTAGLIGIIIGIAISNLNQKSERYMNSFIAGNFLYIGLAQMLPEISEEKSNKIAFSQIITLCLGIGVIYLITLADL